MASKLLFLSGSSRKDSFNKKLSLVAEKMAAEQGATTTWIDLADYEMPIYNGDIEATQGLPEKAIALKAMFVAHHGFFIASPEYNSSFSPLLKNSLDWISRPHSQDEPPLVAYQGKVAALAAASPGGFGGLRGLVPLRMMLGNIGVHVLPQQLAVSFATEAFDANGALTDERAVDGLKGLINAFVDVSNKFATNVA